MLTATIEGNIMALCIHHSGHGLNAIFGIAIYSV